MLLSESPWALRGISLNANGLNQSTLELFQHLFADFQLVAFQETKFSEYDRVKRADYFAHAVDAKAKTFWSHQVDSDFSAARGKAGVGLIFTGRSPFTSVHDVTLDYAAEALRHHYIVAEASISDYRLFIHVVYAPVTVPERKSFLEALPSRFPAGAHHLVLGDFNVPMDPVLDETSPDSHDLGRAEFRSWLLQLGVLDAWRASHPDRREFTGPRRRNRIDYCLLSPTLFDNYLREVRHVTNVRYHHEDHLPIRFQLQSPSHPKQSRLPWKCPRWLLHDHAVQAVLEATLERLCDRIRIGPGTNPGALLDEHKRADAIFLRQMFMARRNKDQAHLSELQEQVYAAEMAHSTAPSDASEALLLNAKSARQAFMELLASRRERAKFDRDIDVRETGSKFFLRPPSTQDFRVAIPGVERDDGSVATDPEEMAALHRQYWGSVFQTPSRDLESKLDRRRYNPGALAEMLQHTTARLSEADRRFLEAPMTANDFYWAIVTSPKGKSSGFDGLPAEYYQLFPDKWARVYELVYASQLSRGRMTKFQRRAYITLLYKKGDRNDPKNYRPITLLNHDAKFGPKIQARRSGTVLPKLVHVDQTGFVPGRSIRHALLRFQDLQAVCRDQDMDEAGAVLLDFAKAFDSVLWPALDQVLRHYGFGPNYRRAVRTFFTGTLVSVLVNGTKSDYFELGCGVRQGDPLSPTLFVLFIEPMLNFLRAKTGHLGIPVAGGSTRHHLLAFADDCTGLLRSLRFAPVFVNAVEQYATAAGLRLNVDKTVILPFQRLEATARDRLEAAGFEVTADEGVTILLGISQSPTLPLTHRLEPLLPKMVARCALWKYRARTLHGRAVILRTIVLPVLWYTAAVTPVTSSFVARVEKIIKAFLFQLPFDPDLPARAPMASEWIVRPTSRGGLGIPAVAPFVSALHLCSLRDSMRAARLHLTVPRWFEAAASLMTSTMAGNGVAFDVLYAHAPKPVVPPQAWSALGSFWYKTLQAWQGLRESPHNTSVAASYLVDAPLWDNPHFRVGRLRRSLAKASTLCCRFRDLGYLRLRDFVERHGCLPSVELCTRLLADEEFSASRLRSLAASHFVAMLSDWFDLSAPVPPGPSTPTAVSSALHGWRLRGTFVIDMHNRDFYRLLHKLRPLPCMPHGALGVASEPDWDKMWRREHSLDRDVLPVLGDLKFRLQHNALGVRVKYQWHTDDVNCVHGCPTIETPRHLFWDCPYAQALWQMYLPTLDEATMKPLDWEAVVFLHKAGVTRTAALNVGQHNFLRVFNVIRCCVLRSLWLHRNERIYRPTTRSSQAALNAHAQCYAQLHLGRLVRVPDNDRLRDLCRSVLAVTQARPSSILSLSPQRE